MCKFATTIVIGLLSGISAYAISHARQRVRYKPLPYIKKVYPSLYVLHQQNHFLNNNQDLS